MGTIRCPKPHSPIVHKGNNWFVIVAVPELDRSWTWQQRHILGGVFFYRSWCRAKSSRYCWLSTPDAKVQMDYRMPDMCWRLLVDERQVGLGFYYNDGSLVGPSDIKLEGPPSPKGVDVYQWKSFGGPRTRILDVSMTISHSCRPVEPATKHHEYPGTQVNWTATPSKEDQQRLSDESKGWRA